jgi:putative phosphoribosyl transferase
MGKLTVLSRSSDFFHDRQEAGRLLAERLGEYIGENPVILGIPRGGIIIAREIAVELGGDIDIVLAHKLGTPGQSELAMGSVAEDGRLFLNDEAIGEMCISQQYIEKERERQLDVMQQRREVIRRVRPKVDMEGRVVIVTDDGVATGSTLQAAVWAIRLERPRRLVIALPVGPADAVSRLAEEADDTICLRIPPFFNAVGQFYTHFDPVEDDQVIKILRAERERELSISQTVVLRPGQ